MCGVCGSFWDLESYVAVPVYDEEYPLKRGHFDPTVGTLKVRTLARWLGRSGAKVEGRVSCEVGFGGGSCLSFLASRARKVYGIEANPAAIEHARRQAINAELLTSDALPPRLTEPVDLWLFQDAFEHIPDPATFTDWLAANSSATAEILLVAPRADSFSQRLMGRWWLHKLPDHQFHWSRRGLLEFMRRRGFEVRTEFSPVKMVSPGMALAHLAHKLGARTGSGGAGAAFAIPFNVGELGVLLSRRAESPR